jgi:copper oxidase (laccase) domain-containing protein
VDLKGFLAWQMVHAGLTQDHIQTLALCTACHPELYWSHRKMGDRRGNQAAMIQLL